MVEEISTLWEKLNKIYHLAEDDFLRVDADVVCNRNVLELIEQDEQWWYQGRCFGWFNQDIVNGGVQFIRKPAIKYLRESVAEAENYDRPETYLSRIEAFYNPRRFVTFEKICGINGYKQSDVDRVKLVKHRRGQLAQYDFDLAEKLESL